MARRSTHRKQYLSRPSLLAAVLVLLLVGGAYALYHQHQSPKPNVSNPKTTSNPVSTKPSSPADNKPNEDRKTGNQASTLDSSTDTTASFSVKIVSTSVNGGNLHVGNQVFGTTSGSCTLTATKSNQTLQLATSSVHQDVNSYDCGAFNVSTSKFPSGGSWQLKLSVTADGATASDLATVTIN